MVAALQDACSAWVLEVFFVYAAHRVLGLLLGHLQKSQGTVLKETSGDVIWHYFGQRLSGFFTK